MNSEIDILVQKIARFPGLGARSARRIVLHLIEDKERRMLPFIASLTHLAHKVQVCSVCGNIDTSHLCEVCSDTKRSDESICVVESVASLWAIERTHCFSGRYHVLGGVLSSADQSSTNLRLDLLRDRCKTHGTRELVIALSATIEGKITEHYIKRYFASDDINITVLAQGIPIGGELEQIDTSTISTAFSDRK